MKKISLAFAFATLTAGMAMGQATLTSVEPAPGATLTADSPGHITVFFEPSEVNIGSAIVTYVDFAGEEQTEELTVAQDEWRPGNPYDIGASADENQIFWYIATQKAQLGSTITLTLSDVTYDGTPVTATSINSSDVAFEDGNIIISYYTPAVRFDIVEQDWPTTYYTNFSDVDAISTAVITYTEDVETVGEIGYRSDFAQYGSEGGQEDAEFGTIPTDACSIDGNVVTFDLAKYPVTFTQPQTRISFYLIGVQSVSGQYSPVVATGHMTYESNGTTVVEKIEATNGEVRYFNLQGVEITNPAKGQIVIKTQNGKASKVLTR